MPETEPTTPLSATVAVIGGSGLYNLFDPATSKTLTVKTPYGPTSSPITVGTLGGKTVAFLTRHGADHSLPPHLISYRANIWALKSLGVKAIVSSAAVGGVSPDYPAGTLILTDQFIDRTSGRADTFYDRGSVQHLSAADPFCPALHRIASRALTATGERFVSTGTVVVIQGPRFSTRAESLWFRAAGAHTVNMTLVPEVPLASELNIDTVNLSFVTDADAGLAPKDDEDSSADAVSAELVFTRLREAQPRIVAAIEAIIRAIPDEYEPRELMAPDAVQAVLDYPLDFPARRAAHRQTRLLASSGTNRATGHLLVTGGAGFIGRAIVDAALEAGYRVRVFDSLRTDVHAASASTGPADTDRAADSSADSTAGVADDTAARHGFDPRVEFVRADITDAEAVATALDGITVVSHQAAKVGLGVDFLDAPDYVATNELGTAILLAAMTTAGIDRLVLASSMVVYGEGSYRGASGITRPAPRRTADLEAGRFDPTDPATGEPLEPAFIGEDAPLDPRNVYASSKLSQEYLATSWARTTAGRAIALRYHNVYGPGMPQNTPYAGVASLFRSAIERGEAPRVFEDGRQRRDFVHVRDVAGANLAALVRTASAEASGFRAYNVGSGTVHTIGDLAAELSRFSGGLPPVTTGEFRLGDVRHITASSERLRSELRWAPQVTFEEGVREFASAPLRAPAGSPS